MGRISRGWELTKASWHLLKADRELIVLPILSGIAILLVGAGLLGLAWPIDTDGESVSAGQYALLVVFYLASYFIGIFSNAAIVAAAMIRIEGGDPTLKDGLRAAWAKKGRVFAWAALAATVGLVLRALEQRAPIFGKIAIWLVGAAWAAVTFFVVPVIVFEERATMDSVKRSAQLFKQKWGEQFTGNAAIGIAMFLVSLPVVLLGGLLLAVSPVLGVIVLVVTITAIAAIGSALSGIFNAALYRYATTGEAAGPFDQRALEGVFSKR